MKRTLALILAVVMTMALVACGGNPGISSTPGSASSSGSSGMTAVEDINKDQQTQVDETKTYKKEIKIALQQAVKQIDPHLVTGNSNDIVYKMMYNQLLDYDVATKELKPELAESWTVESSSSYVFNLRKGVKFSNGEELTADDIVYTFTVRPAAVTGTTGSAVWGEIKTIEVINDYSVRFKLTKADADFLYRMYLAYFAVLNREACEADAEKGHLIGTGGWVLADWTPSDYIHFTRYDDSWVWDELGETPTEEITMNMVTEASARLIALQNQEIAAVTTVGYQDLLTLEADANISALTYSAETLYYYCFNMQNGIFTEDQNLRNAVAYAVNYEDILEMLTYGRGQRAYTMWGLNQYGYYDAFAEKVETNLEKAKEYLAKSTKPEGCTVDLLCIAAHEQIATLMQSQLQQIGITTNIVTTDSAGVTAAIKSGSYDILVYNISLRSDGDRFAFIPNATHSTNRAKYDNPDMMAQFTAALAEADDAKRKDIYKDIQETLNEEKPYVPLYYSHGSVAWNKNVSGIIWSPDTKHDFTSIRWQE